MEYLDLEEGSGETNEIKDLCVVGKVLSNKPCHVSAVSNVCNIAWKTRASFSVVPWGNNIFLFRFEEAEDKDHILKDGPWSISNNLLILEPLEIGGTVEDVEFSHCPFWIQIHGLPVEKMTRANAELIGKRLGKLLAVETSHDGILLGRSFLRVRAAIKVSDPLPKGFWLRRKPGGGDDIWISYKFEKLTDFCYACGRLGHENKGCRFATREDGPNSGYGPGLRTGRVRQSAIPIEEIRQEVDEAEIRVENLLRSRPKVKSGLSTARISDAPPSRVVPTRTVRNDSVPTGSPQSRISDSAPGVTGVHPSLVSGTPTRPPPVIIPNRIVTDLNSLGDPKSLLGSDTLASLSLPSIIVGRTPAPNPNSPTAQYSSLTPPYFVTEPSDSPKSLDSNSLLKPVNLSPAQPVIVEMSPPISPNSTIITPNPTKKTLSPQIDISLATVFKSLAIKRKAQEEPEEPSGSKILRLCAPNYPNITQPNSQLAITHPSKPKIPKVARTTKRKGNHAKPRGSACSGIGDLLVCEENLCEVSIHQSLDGQGNMDSSDTREGSLTQATEVFSVSGNGQGLVAGPKQPQRQC